MKSIPNAQLAIAIIGMSGRFPGAGSVKELWENLRAGRESIRFFSDEELRLSGVPEEVLADPNYVKAAGVLEGSDLFDAEFFGFSPREAEVLDPQHRIFLECAWEALEDAGYDAGRTKGTVGVYAGTSASTYVLQLLSNTSLRNSVGTLALGLSNDKDFLSTRTSYKLNLEGPSVTVQTACSTSLVAVHLGCQALLSGECDMALAGGVSVTNHRKQGYWYQAGGILSRDGHCRAFDQAGGGAVGGNGAGVVLLKRLEEAWADGDRIRAVILGSAINNDGAGKVSYTAPRVQTQARVIRMAHLIAGVTGEEIGYVEAHGTGTALGDPIEVAALEEAFGWRGTRREKRCALGSVKSNIGHLDAAAGIAGLIKTVLAVEHGEIPASLHYREGNREIEFEKSGFFVNTELRRWEGERRAGVSSFGMGGTNAHVIVAEGPGREEGEEGREEKEDWHALVYTARNATSLRRMEERLRFHLEQHPEQGMGDVAYTLQVGRKRWGHGGLVLCRGREEAVAMLASGGGERLWRCENGGKQRGVAFVLAGVGEQYEGMGREQYRSEEVFRQEVDRCCALLGEGVGRGVWKLICGEGEKRGEERERLWGKREGGWVDKTEISQPGMFVYDWAMAQQWIAWGVKPEALLGYSVGECVAGCLAGIMSLEEGLGMVVERARLMSEQGAGVMTAVAEGGDKLEEMMPAGAWVAIENAASACVVGGEKASVEELERRLEGRGIAYRRVGTERAFHTPLMRGAGEELKKYMRRVQLQEPRIGCVSNVTGEWMKAEEVVQEQYWGEHVWNKVRFGRGAKRLLEDGERMVLEIGPGQSLSSYVLQQAAGEQKRPWVFSTMGGSREQLMGTAGKLWLAGADVDWEAVHAGHSHRRVELPTYPFERQRYWLEGSSAAEPGAGARHMQRRRLEEWFYSAEWKRSPRVQPHRATAATLPEVWLLFNDPRGLARKLASRLRAAGRTVKILIDGKSFLPLTDHTSVVNRESRKSMTQMLTSISREGSQIRLVDFANTHATSNKYVADASGVSELLALSQALGELEAKFDLRMWLVTSSAEVVIGTEQGDAEQGMLKGLLGAMRQEYPGLRCGQIDVVEQEEGSLSEQELLEQLEGELRGDVVEAVVAYRGSHRWIPTYEAVRLEGGRARLREGGVYLITGGLGGMGLVMGRYLAREAGARLVLLGRRGLPGREEWEACLQKGEQERSVQERIRAVQEMEELGGQVVVVEADVADGEQMRGAVGVGVERFGAIHGVIHAAGVAGGGMLQFQTVEKMGAVLRPKVEGTRVLEEALREAGQWEGLDFVMLCSSLASLLSGFGQGDYCAANAYLDSYAQQQRGLGKPVMSVNWDLWREVGLAMHTAVVAGLEERRGEEIRGGISPEEGEEVTGRLLGSGLGQVAVSTLLLEERLRQQEAAGAEQLRRAIEEARLQLPRHPRPGLGNAYVGPRNGVEEQLAGIWQELLGVEQIGMDDNFFELGGNSLLALQLLSRVRTIIGRQLSARQFFESGTIGSLASLLQSNVPDSSGPKAITQHQDEVDRLILNHLDELPQDEIDSLFLKLTSSK